MNLGINLCRQTVKLDESSGCFLVEFVCGSVCCEFFVVKRVGGLSALTNDAAFEKLDAHSAVNVFLAFLDEGKQGIH